MKRYRLFFFLISSFAFLIPHALLMASPPVILEIAKELYPLGLHLEYLEDQTGKLNIEDVSSPEFDAQFISSQTEVLDFGVTSSAYWVRVQLHASVRDQEKWLIEIKGINWHLVQFYYPQAPHSWIKEVGGRTLPFDQAIFINDRTLFRLPQPLQQNQTIYLRLEAEMEMVLTIAIWSENDHQEYMVWKLYFLGLYQGILIIMAAYNLFLYISIRDKSYLFYTLYVSTLIAFFMVDDGVGIQIFWGTPILFISKISAFMFCVFEVFFIFFVKFFLQTKRNTPTMDNVLSCSMVFSIGATILFVLLPEDTKLLEETLAGNAMAASILMMMVTAMTIGILCVKRGYAPAKYFLLASTSFLGATALAALQVLGVFPGFDSELVFIKIGALLEAVLYSFALADRYKYERRLKEKSQQQAIEEQKRMTTTFEKFVPKQFLDRVAKEGIQSIKLGNVESEYITILFSDIRSFTTLSETMSPEEVFQFLNSYLSQMEPPILGNGGFVDKFIGDAIMALFDLKTTQEQAHGAIDAALGMQKALKIYNQHRGHTGEHSIHTGIGIHSGKVIIGTVGTSQRMDSTAIGDAVNLASRVEGMTKVYGASILISDEVFYNIAHPSHYSIRVIDRVVAKGKSEPVSVFEVFDEDPPDIKEKKHKTRKRFEEAISLYGLKEFEEMTQLMEEHLKVFPEDKAAYAYIERCQRNLRKGLNQTLD